MRIIPAEWLDTIKGYDKSIDVLYNERKNVWVVVQDVVSLGGGWRRVHSDLRGCPTITGRKSRYKSLFQLKTSDGVKLDPRPWYIIRLLETFYPRGDQLRDGKMFEDAVRREEEETARDIREMGVEIEKDIRNHYTKRLVDLGAK